MITLTLHISHPSVIRGDDRTHLYNSLAQTLDALGPEWNHLATTMDNGNLLIHFNRTRSVIAGVV